jgi:hypothetical protein
MNRLAEQILGEQAAVAAAEPSEKPHFDEPCLCGIPGCYGHPTFSTTDGRKFLKIREGATAEVRFDNEGGMTLATK